MNLNMSALDYLLNDDIVERKWLRITSGYRNILCSKQLNDEFVSSIKSNQSLQIFLQNGFTEFTKELNLAGVERLTKSLASQDEQNGSDDQDFPRSVKHGRRKNSASMAVGKNRLLQCDTLKWSNTPKVNVSKVNAAKDEVSAKLASPSKRPAKRQGAVYELSGDRKVITAAMASNEFQTRAINLGRSSEWSSKALTPIPVARTSTGSGKNNHTTQINSTYPSEGSDQNEQLANSAQLLTNSTKRTNQISTTKPIERLLVEKIATIQASKKIDQNPLSHSKEKVAEKFNPIFADKKLASTMVQPEPAYQSQTLRVNKPIGGLKGLAAIASADSAEPYRNSDRDRNAIDQVSTDQVSATPLTGSSMAKLLAEEARRAGIDLEKFQP